VTQKELKNSFWIFQLTLLSFLFLLTKKKKSQNINKQLFSHKTQNSFDLYVPSRILGPSSQLSTFRCCLPFLGILHLLFKIAINISFVLGEL
jgi:hypothetical protein